MCTGNWCAISWRDPGLGIRCAHRAACAYQGTLMSTDATPSALPSLNALECRLLGVLVEKAKTTPDGYPLSLNALVVGSNQKSNRDPVMNVSDEQVQATLDGLQQRGLVTRITGSRVDRWRHNLYEQ